MIISSFFNKFWAGDIKLWKSFWIIGLLHAFILTRLIQFLETQIFKNENLFLFVQFQDVGIPIINFINLYLKLIEIPLYIIYILNLNVVKEYGLILLDNPIMKYHN